MAQISKEYGGALFFAAEERGETDAVCEAMQMLRTLFAREPDYIAFLSAPNIPKAERIAAARQALSGNVPQTLCSFVLLLCERGYIRSFDDCASEYERLWNEAHNIVTAEVVSAVELKPEEQARLKERLDRMSGKDVRLSLKTDPTLLGGVCVTMNGTVYDGSIKGRMKQIKGVMVR